MNKFIPIFKNILLWCVLAALLIGSLFNQFNFSFKPLSLSKDHIASMMIKNDMQKLETAAPDLFSLVREVSAFPASTRFYFIPCFNDSGNTGRWWWYVYLMARYLSYPRTVFTHDKAEYGDTKGIYLSHFIKEAKTWQELDWITSRHIEVLILMRNNTVEFMRTTAPIKNL